MTVPETLTHRGVQFRQRMQNRLPPMSQIDHQWFASLGADQVLVALRARARKIATSDGKTA